MNENLSEEKPIESYALTPKGTFILEEYREQKPIFQRMREIVLDTLRKSMEDNHIYVTAIEARVKAEDSLVGKLERKGDKYRNLSDMTDILGARVITFYSDEVDKIAAIVDGVFDVDWSDSIDKRKMHDLDSFGYNSLHYICRIPKRVYCDEKQPEINEYRFEIQMRSALQHVWATLDHDTGYKSGVEIPHEHMRNLNRLAGMLELVDEQFCSIRTKINDYRRQVKALVSSGHFEDVPLNGDSFYSYLKIGPFDALNKRIASINQAEIHDTFLMNFLKVFAFMKFKTLGDVDKLIKENSDDAFHLAAIQLAHTDLDIISSSLGVINLLEVYVLKSGVGLVGLKSLFDEVYGPSDYNKTRAERVYEKAKQLAFMNQ